MIKYGASATATGAAEAITTGRPTFRLTRTPHQAGDEKAAIATTLPIITF
jgi:hypothetical protein